MHKNSVTPTKELKPSIIHDFLSADICKFNIYDNDIDRCKPKITDFFIVEIYLTKQSNRQKLINIGHI